MAGIAAGCREAGAALIGGETAEMPGMYAAGDYDLAGFAVGAVERDEILPRSDIIEGDVLIGWPSSGVHSNGYSLVRRLVSASGLGWHDAAPFAPTQTLADTLITPTRIYVKPLLAALRATGGGGPSGAIKALAHITGGGLSENIPRVMPDGLAAQVDLDAFEAPPVFGWLKSEARVDDEEMLRTFNCGIGMIIIAAAAHVREISNALTSAGEAPRLIGKVIRGTGAKTTAKGKGIAEAVVYSGRLGIAQ